MAKRTVLIVDDELTLLRNLRDALRRLGNKDLEVLTAGRADEALELMQLTAVDLVVSDFRMPGQDGISFISIITQKYPNTRCILMTAHGDSDTKNKSMAHGAVSFMEKPFDLDRFISEVDRHLSVSGFTGRGLVGFSLLDILQLVAMSQQSVTITVHGNKGAGSLFIEDGTLIHSETNAGLSGLRAAYDIVSWSDGDIASSRGVASQTERSITMPLMTFLMEAAKYQDEVKRLRPLNNVKDLVNAWCELPDVLAASVLDTEQGSEVHGNSADKDFPRAPLAQSVIAAFRAYKQGLTESAELSPPREMVLTLPAAIAMVVAVLDGRFLALLCARNSSAMAPAKADLDEKLNGLIIALSDFAAQYHAVESGEFESINLGDDFDLDALTDSEQGDVL